MGEVVARTAVSQLSRRRTYTVITLLALTLSGCVNRYGTAVGSFGQMEVSSAPNVDVRILRFHDFQHAYPNMPQFMPATDPKLSSLLENAPSGRPNQGQFLYRTGQYFLTYRCGDAQKFQPFKVTKTQHKAMKVACS